MTSLKHSIYVAFALLKKDYYEEPTCAVIGNAPSKAFPEMMKNLTVSFLVKLKASKFIMTI